MEAKFVYNLPLDQTMSFEQMYPNNLRLSLEEKQKLKDSGAEFIYLVDNETGEVIGETYYIEVEKMVKLDEKIPGVKEWYGKNAIYCYSNTIIEKYQCKGYGKILKRFFLEHAQGKGYVFSIGHARRSSGSSGLNQLLGAKIVREYLDWYGTGETYDFYCHNLQE